MKFIAQRPGFVEVNDDVEYARNEWATWESTRPAEADPPGLIRDFTRGGESFRVRGPFITSILLSDPEVWKVVDALHEARTEVLARWQDLVESFDDIGASAAAADPVWKAIADDRFGTAARAADTLAGAMWTQHRVAGDPVAHRCHALSFTLRRWEFEIWRRVGTLDREGAEMFAGFAPAFAL